MFSTCESSNAHSGSENSGATYSNAELHRYAAQGANEHNHIVGVSRLLAVVLENDALGSSEVAP